MDFSGSVAGQPGYRRTGPGGKDFGSWTRRSCSIGGKPFMLLGTGIGVYVLLWIFMGARKLAPDFHPRPRSHEHPQD